MATPTQDTPTQEPTEQAPGPTVRLTAKAVEMVKRTREQEGMDENYGLRVGVMGGGCSGFQYALDFEQEARPTDAVVKIDGLRVFVDPVSGRRAVHESDIPFYQHQERLLISNNINIKSSS